MRTIPVAVVVGLLLAATSSFAAPAVPAQQSTGDDAGPRGDRWEDRWQGRRHYLYDDQDFYDDQTAATDGHAASAQAHCRTVPVRFKRPDGSTGLRRIKRCD